ncbi:MAG: type II toxin-antitoxin system RelE/ParE family toxin [Myxococcota bacterium]
MRIEIAAQAERHLLEKISYWDTHRPAARIRVEDAFQTALSEILRHPHLGVRYGPRPRYRTWPLKGTPYRVFYLFDEEQSQITIADVWSSQRGKGPELK